MGVAQLIERWVVAPEVRGLNPLAHTKTSWPSGQAQLCKSCNASSNLAEVSTGNSQAAKAPDFGSGNPGFKSQFPVHSWVGMQVVEAASL